MLTNLLNVTKKVEKRFKIFQVCGGLGSVNAKNYLYKLTYRSWRAGDWVVPTSESSDSFCRVRNSNIESRTDPGCYTAHEVRQMRRDGQNFADRSDGYGSVGSPFIRLIIVV